MKPLWAAAEPTTHIVYRSRLEAEQDRFWWELMTEYPTATMCIFGAIALLFFALFIYRNWPDRRR